MRFEDIKADTELTAQQVFDMACEHLLAMPKQCTSLGSRMCVYRGPNGTRCVAGAFLPDTMYQPWMDGEHGGDIITVSARADVFDTELPRVWHEHKSLLRALQGIHDNPDVWQDTRRDGKKLMRQELARVARSLFLNINPLLRE